MEDSMLDTVKARLARLELVAFSIEYADEPILTELIEWAYAYVADEKEYPDRFLRAADLPDLIHRTLNPMDDEIDDNEWEQIHAASMALRKEQGIDDDSTVIFSGFIGRGANRPIAYWLFGCAGLVGTMIAVGGATRLTRSGLSMVEWKPQGSLPPMNQAEWEAEFEKYKKFPEYQQRKGMTLSEFKGIFFWEYGHRMLGRTVGLAYVLPLTYFMLRKRLPKELHGRFAFLFGLGATQGGIGWWMVRSGLEEHGKEQLAKQNEVRVSPYRLATHLGFAFTTLGVLMWTGFTLLSPPSRASFIREMISPDVLKETGRIRKNLHRVSAVLGYTILSGAFVAGIDAGLAYNTFPKMGDQWIPDGLFDMDPWYKNFFENTPLVQLDHRILAMSTLAGYTACYGLARRGHIWNQLPQESRTALNLTMAAVSGQVLLGISTLLNYVPIPLAVAHQSGAMVLLTSSLWTLHTLNFARPAAKMATKVVWFTLFGVIYISFYFFTSPFVGNPELLTTWTPYIYVSMGLYGWLITAAAMHTPLHQLGVGESTIKQPISLLFPFFSVSFGFLVILELAMVSIIPRATTCLGMEWKTNNVTYDHWLRSFANAIRNSAAISVACVALIIHCDPQDTPQPIEGELSYNQHACEQLFLFSNEKVGFVPASYRGALVVWIVGVLLATTNFVLERSYHVARLLAQPELEVHCNEEMLRATSGDSSPKKPKTRNSIRNWLGGWLLPQRTSHFCIKLPHNWWFLGLDLALENDINMEQYALFESIAKNHMGENDAVIIATHEPRWILDTYEEDEKTEERLSYLIDHVRYALLNVIGFRRINWRFDIIGGLGYFFLVFSMFPRCSAGAIYASPTWSDAISLFVDELWSMQHEMLASSYVSLLTAVGMFISIAAFADTTSHLKRCITALIVSAAHCIAACSILVLFECIIDIATERGSLGREGNHSLYEFFSASLPSSVTMSSGSDPSSAMRLFADFMKLCMTIFDELSRMELWQYYMSVLPYYFVLATPVVGVIFGVYLYVSVNVFGRHYNEAFSALRIASYKNFVRLHFQRNGDLELFVFGVDKMPKKWRRDPNWSGSTHARNENHLPSHRWSCPSYWKPVVTKVGNLLRLDFENPELDAHLSADDRSIPHLVDRVVIRRDDLTQTDF
ncbi:hypothetical protein P43SY_001389 [Pythium insidiosum]|uniref:Cytochrome c oxidase assembly protein cox15 n=1 Tax=Pythium insidiosum TaxID=114742 RepID=A0AAD5QAD5_PYTIN|nr:hypothetical protein P43SY_001389 [Pythium insidiosum]